MIHPCLGGRGDDRIVQRGGAGNDDISARGGRGDDRIKITGGRGRDKLRGFGGAGDDRIKIKGGRGRDRLKADGGAGNDIIRLRGGHGKDQIIYKASPGKDKVTLNAGKGNDEVLISTNGHPIVVMVGSRIVYSQGEGGTVVRVKKAENISSSMTTAKRYTKKVVASLKTARPQEARTANGGQSSSEAVALFGVGEEMTRSAKEAPKRNRD